MLLPRDFITIAAKNGWQNLDLIDGVKLGYAKGFFENGPGHAVQLTKDGFAAILAMSETKADEARS